VVGDIHIDSEALVLLITDFMNFKIKPIHSFIGAHRGRVCMCMFIGLNTRMCISIYIYTVFLIRKK
jgi:hypothetical protein